MRTTRIDWKRRRRGITARYRRGWSLREIAEELGVSHTTVCKRLDQWGVRRRSGDGRRGLLVNDLTGRRFGRLRVLGRDGVRYPVRWIVRCDCGTERSYTTTHLRRVRSCGCAPRGPRPNRRRRR